jgi:hypothetical protein
MGENHSIHFYILFYIACCCAVIQVFHRNVISLLKFSTWLPYYKLIPSLYFDCLMSLLKTASPYNVQHDAAWRVFYKNIFIFMFTGITPSFGRTAISLQIYNLYGKASSNCKVNDHFVHKFY